MKKVCCFFLVLFILSALIIPASAAEIYTFDVTWDGNLFKCDSSFFPGPGRYLVTCTLFGNSIAQVMDFTSFTFGSFVEGAVFSVTMTDTDLYFLVHFSDLPFGTPASVTFELIPSYDFIDSASDGLSSIVSMFGSIADSILTGSLSPLWILMAVGISISIIFMVIRVIKSFTWGL